MSTLAEQVRELERERDQWKLKAEAEGIRLKWRTQDLAAAGKAEGAREAFIAGAKWLCAPDEVLNPRVVTAEAARRYPAAPASGEQGKAYECPLRAHGPFCFHECKEAQKLAEAKPHLAPQSLVRDDRPAPSPVERVTPEPILIGTRKWNEPNAEGDTYVRIDAHLARHIVSLAAQDGGSANA